MLLPFVTRLGLWFRAYLTWGRLTFHIHLSNVFITQYFQFGCYFIANHVKVDLGVDTILS